MELYVPTTGRVVAWVRIPSLSSTSDTVINITYGCTGVSISQENITGVWNSDYYLVHHMGETSGTVYDSTSNNNDSTTESGIYYHGAGKLGYGFELDEYLDYYIVDNFSYGDSFTISIWAKVYNNVGSYNQSLFAHGSGPFDTNVYACIHEDSSPYPDDTMIRVRDSAAVQNYLWSDVSAGDPNNSDGSWHKISWTRTRAGISTLYVDGQLIDSYSTPSTAWAPNTDLYIGSRFDLNADRFFGGYLDEFRISTPRSSDWETTEYANQNYPATFYTVADVV